MQCTTTKKVNKHWCEATSQSHMLLCSNDVAEQINRRLDVALIEGSCA